jgi:glycine cleavage system H protein
MSETRYTKEHEWVRVDGEVATTGISNHAQEQLGDVVFVELPEVGAGLSTGDSMGVVESVKAASDIYAPISGEVVEINDALEGEPALINSDAEGNGWICKIKVSQPDEVANLMDADTYREFVENES